MVSIKNMPKLKLCYPLNPPYYISQKWDEGKAYYEKIGMRGHNGWDFVVPTGTPVYAMHDGMVISAGIDSTQALTISIDTHDMFDYKDLQTKFRTLYTHLSRNLVAYGDKVKKGQLIGYSGNSGLYTTGAHLHIGVKAVNGDEIEKDNGYNGATDPQPYFDGTYPMNETLAPHVKSLLEAVKLFQVKEGLMDFANETDLRKIRIGAKTLSKLRKYQK